MVLPVEEARSSSSRVFFSSSLVNRFIGIDCGETKMNFCPFFRPPAGKVALMYLRMYPKGTVASNVQETL